MSRDKQSNDSEESNDQVQDYLDMLLSSATEMPEAQVPMESIEKVEPAAVPAQRGTARLAMVGGTHAKPVKPTKPLTQPVSKASEPRPFAEPNQPLKLKMPLPKVQAKAEPPAATPATVTQDKVKPSRVETVEKPIAEKPIIRKHAPVSEPVKTQPQLKSEAPALKPSVETPVVPSPQVPQEATIEPEVEEQAQDNRHLTTVWMDNGRPEWAQERFECLLFKVGGLSLAVPLVELGTIYPMTDELTPLFGQAGWFMGLLTVKENNIRTVNTAKIVMPERYTDKMIDDFAYVLSINGVDWGLAVDSVANAVTLQPEDVRWRSERSKRPWLAGTVVDHMCALLDVSQLAAMFLGEDKSQ